MRLSRAVSAFLEEARLNKSRNTYRAYALDLNRMRRYAGKDTVKCFDTDLLARILGDLVSQNRAANTKSRCISTLRVFGDWLVEKEVIAKNPVNAKQFNVRGQVTLPRPFSPEEVGRLLALELSPLENTVRALLMYTGLRNSPICNLTVSDVSFTPEPGVVRSVGKGNKRHAVPIAPELAPILRAWLDVRGGKSYDRLLVDENDRPMNQRRLERMCNEWGAQAGVANCIPHRWRHTCGTEWLRNGAQLHVVQRLLGHSNIATTQVYTKVQDDVLIAAVMARSASAPTSIRAAVQNITTVCPTIPAGTDSQPERGVIQL